MFLDTIKTYTLERLHSLYQKYILFKLLDLIESCIYGYFVIVTILVNISILPYIFNSFTDVLLICQKDMVFFIQTSFENFSALMNYGTKTTDAFYVLLNTLISCSCSFFWSIAFGFLINVSVLHLFYSYYKKHVDPDIEEEMFSDKEEEMFSDMSKEEEMNNVSKTEEEMLVS